MNFIVAADNNYAIGKNNDLLYNLPSDLQYFKKITLNKVVVMGEKTFLSLPNQKPLNNRVNIILTLNKNLKVDGAIVVNSLEELFNLVSNYKSEDVFIIGGASIYNQLIPYCNKAYITKINAEKPADTCITNIEKLKNWKLINESEKQTENNLEFRFLVFENKMVQKF